MEGIIINKEQSNLGGINSAQYFAVNEVETFGDIINGAINEIALLPDILPATLEHTSESGSFTEEQLSPNLFSYEFNCLVPRDKVSMRNILSVADRNKLIAIVTDNNGNKRILGEPQNGCLLTTKFGTGTKVAELNAYSLTFTWLSRYRAAYANTLTFLTIPPSFILQNGGYLKLQNGGYLILQ